MSQRVAWTRPDDKFCGMRLNRHTSRIRMSLIWAIAREVLMRNLFAGVVVAIVLLGIGASVSRAGPHGCYSSHCGKH